jgi:hypothetical protein
MAILARVLIDWGNDGAITADDMIDSLFPYTIDSGPDGTIDGSPAILALEDVTADVRQAPPLMAIYGRDAEREYQPPRAGRATFVLDNRDAVYSSLNTASPLFGRLNPGLLCRIGRSADGGATWFYVHSGYTDAPSERPGVREQQVAMTSFDGLAALKAASRSTSPSAPASTPPAGRRVCGTSRPPTRRSTAGAWTTSTRSPRSATSRSARAPPPPSTSTRTR